MRPQALLDGCMTIAEKKYDCLIVNRFTISLYTSCLSSSMQSKEKRGFLFKAKSAALWGCWFLTCKHVIDNLFFRLQSTTHMGGILPYAIKINMYIAESSRSINVCLVYE